MKNRTFNLIVLPLLLAVAIFSGICFFNEPRPIRHTPIDIKAGKQAIIATDNRYIQKMDSLETGNRRLHEEADSIKRLLDKARVQNRQLREQAQGLSTRITETDDTGQRLVACDSLVVAVAEMASGAIASDSLFMLETGTLRALIGNRDSAITAARELHTAFRLSLSECHTANELLLEQNKSGERSHRRLRTKSRLLSATVAVLSAAAVYSFINH